MASPLLFEAVTLLAVVNPVEAAAAFATLVGDRDPLQQKQIALRAAVVAFIILVGFAFVGGALLTALGIGFPAFRIAGGLLLFCVGFNMVFAKDTAADKISPGEQSHAQQKEDPSVFPLAIPIITGPGALATIVALMPKNREAIVQSGLLVAVSAVVLLLTYAAMRASRWLTRAFGPTGINAVGRIMGMIVAAIAIQMITDGVQQLFPRLMR
ncbi:MAG TPA: MarC family protein [Tepidisphaeraceae bacterium]|nr:MarC family protein [Tepidisphaeraceae bacterium]